ncbi:MAG: hypothetical protein AAF639_35415 [Chloroflexota bacterium]
MELHQLVVEIKQIERRLTLYEEKYGVLSEDFYNALMSGSLSAFDEYDETRADFSRWKGIYETVQRRRKKYAKLLQGQEIVSAMRLQPAY